MLPISVTTVPGLNASSPSTTSRVSRRWPSSHAVDAIVHCGAISGPMMAKGEPLKLVAVNIDATAALLDLARRRAMRRFVFCSSISVYGDVGAATITEETPLRPTSVYGATKVACEQLLQGFRCTEYGLEGVSLRIARVYGPYRRANCHVKSLIEDSSGEASRPEIPCDPDFVYHYVYVDDVAEAIATALETARLPQPSLQCRVRRGPHDAGAARSGAARASTPCRRASSKARTTCRTCRRASTFRPSPATSPGRHASA